MNSAIIEIVLSFGADVCGIANIERFADAPEGFSPCDLFADCKSIIVFGVALPKGITKTDPRLIYGHYNNFCCQQVDTIAFNAAKAIENQYNCCVVPIPSDSPYEYWDDDNMCGRGLISMKHAAILAGIGTLGKNTLLMNGKYGNLLALGAMLTDLNLPSDEVCDSICVPGCTKCVDSCPAGAICDGTVNQKLCRNHTYGKNKKGFDTVDCNLCRTVCPMRYGKDKEHSL